MSMKVHVMFLLNMLMKLEMNVFYEYENIIKRKLNFFNPNKLNFQPRT